MNRWIITEDVAKHLTNYLFKRPFIEVNELLAMLQSLKPLAEETNEKVKEEKSAEVTNIKKAKK